MPQNRTRNKAVTIRMTEEEYALFETHRQKAKTKNQTDFFMECLKNKPIIVIEDLKPVLIELKHQGINLNQIARHFNTGGPMSDEIKAILKNCNSAYKKLLDMELKDNAPL